MKMDNKYKNDVENKLSKYEKNRHEILNTKYEHNDDFINCNTHDQPAKLVYLIKKMHLLSLKTIKINSDVHLLFMLILKVYYKKI